MSILCYVTFNDGGSVLKGVFGEWGPMFSPESPALARSAASQWGPRPPVRSAPLRAQLSSAQLSCPRSPPPPSPPLAAQISSSRLNRFFYFIPLSSGGQPPLYPPSTPPSVSQPHPPARTDQKSGLSFEIVYL